MAVLEYIFLAQVLLHRLLKPCKRKRLDKVIHNAQLQSFGHGLDFGGRRHHNDREVPVIAPNPAQQFDAIHAGHINIHDGKVGFVFLQIFLCGRSAVENAVDLKIPQRLQILAVDLSYHRVILYYNCANH